MRNRYIKHFAVSALVCALSHTAVAVAVRVDAPLPEHDDGEAAAETLTPVMGGKDRTLRLTLSFEATPTNSVEVALGAGPDPLDPDGTAMVIGWDCGEWFVAGDKLRQRLAVAAADPTVAGLRTLTVTVRLGPGGRAEAFEERPGAGRTPVAFGGALGAWAGPSGWDTLRVVSRGGADAAAEVKFFADGSAVIVR